MHSTFKTDFQASETAFFDTENGDFQSVTHSNEKRTSPCEMSVKDTELTPNGVFRDREPKVGFRNSCVGNRLRYWAIQDLNL